MRDPPPRGPLGPRGQSVIDDRSPPRPYGPGVTGSGLLRTGLEAGTCRPITDGRLRPAVEQLPLGRQLRLLGRHGGVGVFPMGLLRPIGKASSRPWWMNLCR